MIRIPAPITASLGLGLDCGLGCDCDRDRGLGLYQTCFFGRMAAGLKEENKGCGFQRSLMFP